MGAGKTTVGKRLASVRGLSFVDSDHEIEARTGADIPLIFEKEGEAGFRRREAAMIEELTQLDRIVLATGGGAILNAQSRQHLAARGTVVYLCASVEHQLARTARAGNRPLLNQSSDRRATLENLFALRDPLYREIADLVIAADGRNAVALCREIEERLAAPANA